VLDGHSAAALAFTRSLGRAGHWVSVGANREIFAAAALSRYCRLSFEYPVSTDDASAFSDAVLDFVRKHKIDLILPMTDWTTLPMSRYRGKFEGVSKIALPSHATLELASDKYATVQLAQRLNIPTPPTSLIRSIQDLDRLSELGFPLVVKDRSSARWVGERAVLGSVSYAYSCEDLHQKVEQRLSEAGDVLVQGFAPGLGVGFSCLASDGKIFIPFQWERIRETDPRGSGSSSRKSVPLDPQIVDFSTRLILESGYQGIVMVEYKKALNTGEPILMEINGRPWGSIALPIACGIDYPHYFVDWCLEDKLPPQEIKYKNIVCRRMVGELGHLDNVRRGKPPGWPLPYPDFWTTLAKVAMPWYPGVRFDDVWLSDLRPGVAGVSNWLSGKIKKKSAVGRS
jgi:predicted ATP-grasp superfamily ATP-dependent carboligase